MQLKTMVRGIALIGMAAPALAQPTAPPQRVEITGSSIKRVQSEGALPVQTISRQDIDRAGIVSAEQLVMRLSANGTGADNLSSNAGIQLGTTDRNNNGNSSANLRGLGSSSTLVLLNGRRIPAHGAKGNSVDLNWIPLAAVERVEVLKDGASAIYGTDAIGGVINFILRKDYRGLEATAFVDATEAGGGNIYRGSLLGGWGDLSANGVHLMASLTVDRQEKLPGERRGFSNGYQPERGLSPDTAGAPFASQTGLAGTAIGATFLTPEGGTQTFNRANLLSFQGQCDSVPAMSQYQYQLWASPGARYACAYDYGGAEVLIQPIERTNLVGRGEFALGQNHTAFVEAVASRSIATKQFEPYQITTSLATAYPVNGPYYQDLSAYIPSFDRTKPIAYRWRCTDCGKRTIETTTDGYRFLAGLEGVFGGWDYRTGLSSAQSKAASLLVDGYLFTNPLNAALASGQINPWLLPGQTQTAAAQQLLAGASAAGTRLFDGKSSTTELDGTLSGELMKLPAGPLALALGFDLRKESYQFDDGSRASQPVFLAPFDPQFPKASRNIKAVFAELAIPVFKQLEASVAVRHDDYSDFGGTTNPKLSFKWTPIQQLALRGSYNTGFRAPSFFQLFTATTESQVPGNIADPQLCPNGATAPGADLSVCAIRPNGRNGGNPDLKPEESKQWTIGLVFSPADWLSGSIDLWEIKRQNLIYELTPQQVIANYTTFPESLVRGSNGRLDGSGGYIRAGFVNADGDITRGVDLNLLATGKMHEGVTWNAWLEGTYMDSHRSRIFSTQAYVETVGQWNNRDLFVRWKHQLGFTLNLGPWSGTLSQSYTAGYKDQKPAGTVPAGFNPDVDSYTVYNASLTYTGVKNLSLTFGVKNLLDTDPPFTAHNLDFAAGAGWDPRVADPRGRAYTLRLNYKFL
ncbi:TonB-dependent receptor [Aquabacterium sp.]|uniref:TonB-dependent receptor n=1 Tax=Aquabacterium sp. TaxID=1872578 RepID=UPI002C0AC72A|nr:TonB-dependent receptor [Aquabacterium sp.]HSW03832.1 TonB-dependent receptor [Aquabacterium sp.]